MGLSLIIPVFNERPRLPLVLNRLASVRWPLPCDWVIVDDGSTDGSREFLQSIANEHPEIRLLCKDRNEGKGAAIRSGIALCQGDIIVIQDADLEYDPQDIIRLIEPIRNEEVDVVYGSRFKPSSETVHRTLHRLINRFLTFLSNIFSGIYLTDMETCYKAFRKEVLMSLDLSSRRFEFEIEVTAYIANMGLTIREIGVSYRPRTRLMGKKISWRDGIAALWYIFYFNGIRRKNYLTPFGKERLERQRSEEIKRVA